MPAVTGAPASVVPEALPILGYGLVAALSPTVFLATLAVLGSGRGRLNGVVFLIAFVVGQSLTFLVALLIGSEFSPNAGAGRVRAVLELAAGIGLVGVGWQRRSGHRVDESGERLMMESLFAKLSRVAPAVSFGVGLPLGIGVKRLLITILAAATVASAGLAPADEVALGVEYVVIATFVVWLPVLVYLVFGARADTLMADAKRWITLHEDGLTILAAFAVGLFLIGDALVQLL
jgi:hypothetical protein